MLWTGDTYISAFLKKKKVAPQVYGIKQTEERNFAFSLPGLHTQKTKPVKKEKDK